MCKRLGFSKCSILFGFDPFRSLYNNNIGDVGAAGLGEGLKVNNSVQKLS